MSSVKLQGNASGSGSVTLASPNTNNNQTISLPDATTTMVGTDATQTLTNKTLTSPTITGASMSSMASSVITSGTSQASTSGTAIDFTGLPSWVKRITVMFNGVSTSGTSVVLIQLGSGSFTTSGYTGSGAGFAGAGSGYTLYTTGFGVGSDGNAAYTRQGSFLITNQTGNSWICSGTCGMSDAARLQTSNGAVTLGGVLDRVRITTVNGTDTFDAGSINILYE